MAEGEPRESLAALEERIRALEAERDELVARLRARTDALAQSQRLMSLAIDAVLLHDIRGRIHQANPQAVQMFGLSATELCKLRMQDLDVALAARPGALVEAEWKSLEPGASVVHHGRGVRPDGSTFPTEMRVGAIVVGETRTLVSVIRDTTDRDAFEEALREAGQRFRFIFEGAPVGMMTASPYGTIVQANPAFQRMFGHKMDELHERTLVELADARDRPLLREGLERLVAGEIDQLQRDIRFTTRLGQIVWAHVAMFAEYDAHQVHQIIGVLEDITERKRAEESFAHLLEHLEDQVRDRTRELGEAKEAAEAASRAKSRFLATVSHELRTPLNAIIGYTEMLAEDAEARGHADYLPDLARVTSASKHLLGLINDILDLSKIEAGRVDLYLEDVALVPVVVDVTSTMQPLAEQSGNQLELAVAPGLGTARVDVTKLWQILLNLVGNACKFTREGRIRLSAERGEEDGTSVVVFEVADTGVGLDASEVERIFQPFTQADASTTRRFGGTGLGLSITKHFVEILGGRIDVRSEPGEGSVFRVVLPTAGPVDTPAPDGLRSAPSEGNP
ncbi:MAG: PAS domain S-box protein [Polyangiales bacterium]